eukprot:1434543-Rhodomonas_salina.1
MYPGTRVLPGNTSLLELETLGTSTGTRGVPGVPGYPGRFCIGPGSEKTSIRTGGLSVPQFCTTWFTQPGYPVLR